MHAIDNPSPPPSPPAALSIFDPYHTTTHGASADYQTDLMSLRIGGETVTGDTNSIRIPSTHGRRSSALFSVPATDSPMGDSTTQQDLITFDSFSTSPQPASVSNHPPAAIQSPLPQHILSVDEMLSQSPHAPNPSPSIPGLTIRVTGEDALPSPMAVDSPNDAVYEKHTSPDPVAPQIREIPDLLPPDIQITPQICISEEPSATPLRRSTRPRRSVTPNPPPSVPPPVFTAPQPSPARTLVRKKHVNRTQEEEEIVSDSQDEDENPRQPPSRVELTSNRVRHRSPGKEPFSFHRELGSLSPTSANVLSSLAFTPTDNTSPIPGSSTQPIQSPSEPPTVFSFSIFQPPSGSTAAPSTPVRSNGPIRAASPPKGETSPNKFLLQAPAQDDSTYTPARRIPIEEAIAQGHVSPEKAVQMGFKPNGTPLATINTPARRILVADKGPPPGAKGTGLRFGSPTKQIPIQRERSVEPGYRVVASAKGKERAAPTLPEPSSSIAKPLPYPIVAATPSTSTAISAALSMQTASQDNLTKSLSSPTKSTLKKVTSRIPRIGTKPYARSTDVKAPEKTKPATTIRAVDLTKVVPIFFKSCESKP